MTTNITPESPGEERLAGSLMVLGFTGYEPSHIRYGLLNAIFMFAALGKDIELEQAAELAMTKIRMDNEMLYGKGKQL